MSSAQLLAAARAVGDAGARAVLVSGEAGIGKTHLARAAADRLGADGVTVAWGRADPVERSVPYSAITQVLAALPGRHRLARRSTSRAARRRRPPRGLPAGGPHSRRRARPVPLVVVIDDLHHADEDTLVLLGFLVRRMADQPDRLGHDGPPPRRRPVAGADRAAARVARGPPARRAPARRARPRLRRPPRRHHDRPPARRRRPRGRRAAGQRQPVLRHPARPLAARGRDARRRRHGGRRAGVATGRAARTGGPARRGCPRRRAGPPPCSATSTSTSSTSWPTTSTAGRDRVHDGFDRLVRADLLRPQGDRYEFTHDLIRETLYEDLAPAARRRLHGVAASVLLAQRARGDAVDVVELARHLSLASPGPDAAAADALREAGDVMLRSSPRSAALRYRQAIGYLPASGAGALHVRLARALHRAGQPDEVARVCRSGLGDATGAERDALTRYLSAALADLGDLGGALSMVDHEIAANGPSVVLLTTRALLHRLARRRGGRRSRRRRRRGPRVERARSPGRAVPAPQPRRRHRGAAVVAPRRWPSSSACSRRSIPRRG